MYRLQGRLRLKFVAVFLACCVGCTQPPQKSTLGYLPGQQVNPLEPKVNATTYFAHGHLLERQGQFERAVVQYRKALTLQPEFLSARNRLGITLNKLGRNAEASDQFRLAIASHPGLAYLYNNLGFSLYLEDRYRESREALQQALELKPDFPRAHMNNALVLARLGRFDDAFTELSLACSDADACFNMGIILTEAERYADAAHYLEVALTARPNFPAARQQLREVSRLAAELEARQAAELAATAALDAEDATPETPDLPKTEVAETTTPQTAEAVVVAPAAPTDEEFPEAGPADQAAAETSSTSEAAAPTAAEGQTVTESASADEVFAEPAPPPETGSDQPEPPAPVLESTMDMDTDLMSFMIDQALAALQLAPEEPEEPSPAAEPAPDIEQMIAMIDEALTALLNRYDEFEGLWCTIGYHLFPETAPRDPAAETEPSEEADEFLDAVRDTAIGK